MACEGGTVGLDPTGIINQCTINADNAFFFFFLQVFSPYTTLRVITDLKYLYVRALAWLFALADNA